MGARQTDRQTDRQPEMLEPLHEGGIRQLAWMNTNTVSWFKQRRVVTLKQ